MVYGSLRQSTAVYGSLRQSTAVWSGCSRNFLSHMAPHSLDKSIARCEPRPGPMHPPWIPLTWPGFLWSVVGWGMFFCEGGLWWLRDRGWSIQSTSKGSTRHSMTMQAMHDQHLIFQNLPHMFTSQLDLKEELLYGSVWPYVCPMAVIFSIGHWSLITDITGPGAKGCRQERTLMLLVGPNHVYFPMVPRSVDVEWGRDMLGYAGSGSTYGITWWINLWVPPGLLTMRIMRQVHEIRSATLISMWKHVKACESHNITTST